ncbi:MAG: YlmC/YmxH family sporulation protein [Ruminococcaceae bacterium]|nr:YlmC/YmxH family sporulation protein [Oscillospiraceae bacterium]
MKKGFSTLCDLRRKEIINVCTGTRLGCVSDVEIDLDCGKIIAIIVPEHQCVFSFKAPQEYRIPWDCISKIGDDIIIVNAAYPMDHSKI